MYTKRIFALISMLLLACVMWGQSERGTISGTVRDTTGGSIPGAQVVITNTATNSAVTLTTSGSGEFTAPNLAVGPYTVRVEMNGFKPAQINGITVEAASEVRADTALEVGSATAQTIEVQAAAVQLHSEDSKSSVTIQNKLVDQLPLVVSGALRSPFDLAALTPEAKNIGGDNGFALGGGQAASYGVTLDGVSSATSRALSVSWVATNSPSLEAITEFTVDTNGFKAEYGHAGGGVMTFVSKSGTNNLHGTAYEFLRNNALDANNFFNNSKGLPRPIYKQHDFGFSVGGPVYIPKLYHGRNKTFFFTAYEGFRNRTGATGIISTVPTPEMYQGDFSNWVDKNGKQIPIYNPTTQVANADGTFTRTVFPGNKIPMSLFDPQAVKALAIFTGSNALKPNTGALPGTVGYVANNFVISNGSQVAPQNKLSVKGDHIFSEKDRISGLYLYSRGSLAPGPEGPATLPGLWTDYNNLLQNSDVLRASYDHTFSPTVFNHFYAGGNNWRQSHDPIQATNNWKDKLCLGNVPDCNQNLANFTFSNNYFFQTGNGNENRIGGQANNGSENLVVAFNDDLSIIRGKHSYKVGGMYQITHYNGFGRQCVSGCANFSFKETGVPGGSDQTAGGNPFASFLLGYADSGNLDTVRFIGQQWKYFAGFVQDDWRVNQKLTLNIGLRWETQLPPVFQDDRMSDFSPTTPNPGAGGRLGALIFAGSGAGRQGSRDLADSYYHAFGPRFGFAYSWNEKTVIRGGAGISYGPIQTVSGSTHQLGFTSSPSFPNSNNGLTPTFILSQGFPAWAAPPFIDPSRANGNSIPWYQGQEATRPPTDYNFNLSIQRQLSSSLVFEVSYNGVMGAHLQTGLLNYNQVPTTYLNQYGSSFLGLAYNSPQAIAAGIVSPFPGFKGTVGQALRPYPQYQNIDTAAGGGDHSGHSTYHAAVVRLEKRYGSGLTFQTSYVFSKLLTDSDSYWFGSQAADQYNRGLEKSIGQYDVTHNFKAGIVYDLPFGKGKRFLSGGIGSAVLGNWRVSSTNYYSSGQPIALSTSVAQNIFGGRNVPFITSYDGWRAPTKGDHFDPAVDTFLVPYVKGSTAGPYPDQSLFHGIGNATRYNPKVRQFPNLNENFSVAKAIPIREQVRLEFRGEAFNAFNRVRFGTGSTNLQDSTFGRLTGGSSDLLNTPRQLQFALKLYF